MHNLQWSKREKQIARAAFERAFEREAAAFIALIRVKALEIAELPDAWNLEQMLRDKRRELDQRYDYRYSALIFVFADLILAGWLNEDELADLADDKRARIATLVELARSRL